MVQSLVGNWSYPTAIRFGAGRIRELPEACKAVGLKRPLLVTDPGLAKLPMIADAMVALRKAGLDAALFSEVRPNPVAANVEAGVRILRAAKNDGVIAWGGGSAIDTAKAIAFMAGQDAAVVGFRGCRRLVDARQSRRDLSLDRCADHGRHRLGDRPRLGDHQRGDATPRR